MIVLFQQKGSFTENFKKTLNSFTFLVHAEASNFAGPTPTGFFIFGVLITFT